MGKPNFITEFSLFSARMQTMMMNLTGILKDITKLPNKEIFR